MKVHHLGTLLSLFMLLGACTASIPTEKAGTESLSSESIADGGVAEDKAKTPENPPPSPFKGGWLSDVSKYAFREFRVGDNGESYIVGARNFSVRGKKEGLSVVTKVSKDGLPLWSKEWGTSAAFSGAAALAILGQRGVVVAGSYLRSLEDNCPHPKPLDVENPPYRVYLTFLDAKNGKRLWTQDSNECSNRHSIGGVSATPAGDRIYVSGAFVERLSFGSYSLSGKSKKQTGFLAAFDEKGTPLWVKKTKHNQSPRVFALKDGGALVLDDHCVEGVAPCNQSSLSRWNPEGAEVSRTLFRGILTRNREISFSREKEFLYFQIHDRRQTENLTQSLLKVDVNGKVLWRTSYQYSGLNSHSLGVDRKDQLYISFYFSQSPKLKRKIDFLTKSFTVEDKNVIVKVGPEGKLKWSHTTPTNEETLFYRIRFDSNNASYIYGSAARGAWFGPHLAKEGGSYIWKIPKMP